MNAGETQFSIQQSSFSIAHDDLHVACLFVAEAQVVAAEAEFDRVTQGGSADDLDVGAVAEAHFQQASAEVGIAAHRKDAAAATHSKLVEPAGIGGAAVITGGKATCLLHTGFASPERIRRSRMNTIGSIPR